ncbi:hypothetical protein [Rickettsiella endosymbiont of Miltochrista miniata]|uniref:hypothetical protein n=1 Tax=Rickettsiella endosymbiont of Miltochrista miniata TaxID=3066239 RepID=UPI00313F3D1B
MQKIEINNQLFAEAQLYGKEWSLLFHEFSYWLIHSCQQSNIKKLYFFTREGTFFIELVKALQEKFNIYDTECHLLSVSRLATFLPSVEINDQNAFQRLWNIYPNQSPEAFFRSLDIEDERLQALYNQEYGSYDKEILGIAKNPIFNQFLKNDTVDQIIKKAIVSKKELLTEYLKQNNFLDDTPVGIVDIGWRGSIQDNISLIFPEKKIYGFYLGLHRQKKFISKNYFKKAFLFDGDDAAVNRLFTCLMRFVLPLEFLCTPIQGSVKRYIIDQNNKVIPETHKTEIMADSIVPIFQQSVLDAITSYQLKNKFRLKECRKIAKQIVWNPKGFQIYFYSKSKFNETFGLGISARRYDIGPVKSIEAWIKALKKSAWISGHLYNKLPKPLFRTLPILYLLYCLLTFDSYLLH